MDWRLSTFIPYLSCNAIKRNGLLITFINDTKSRFINITGTYHTGTFISYKCVVYYAKYCSLHRSSKI